MAEIKVKKEEKGELVRWPSFEMTPLFREGFFDANPFRMMRRFSEEMDRWFGGMKWPAAETFWMPSVEVKEKEGKLLVSAELPGLKKEDVKVEVSEGNLVLEGERKEEKEEKKEGYYHSERSYGKFYRSIPLPEGADLDKATAEFSNGVLQFSVPIPKAETRKREIPVKEAKAA